MDRRERTSDPVEQFTSAFEGLQAQLWTSFPATISSVNPPGDMPLTVNVQPALQAQLTDTEGVVTWVDLPLLLDCPVVFPSGGGFTLTFPLAAGDEVLVVIASRCIDNWYAQQGPTGPSGLTRQQAEIRMHDLSDGFVLPGIRNRTRVLPDISTTDVQLRSDAGTAQISIRGDSTVYIHSDVDVIVDSDADVFVQAAGVATVTAPSITLQGNVTITGSLVVDGGVVGVTDLTVDGNLNVVGAINQGGKDVGALHTHTGVQTGTGHSGTVT